MVNVFVDPAFTDDERRAHIYAGDVIVYTSVPEVEAFAAFARDKITRVFAPHDPLHVHDLRTREALTDVLINFKPAFIHDPESVAHVRRIVESLGAAPADVYADVPKLRTAFPVGHLDTGIAYAFQVHRDTWYAAPPQQINWWMPVWPVTENNAMEFYPRYYGQVRENNSHEFDYRVFDGYRGRIKDVSGQQDTRVHPAPVTPLEADEPVLRLLPPVGGIMVFSGDQLHATTPNTSATTRFSIDFRTVDCSDVRRDRGAPRADVACRGTALGDFRRMTDGCVFGTDDLARYDTPAPVGMG